MSPRCMLLIFMLVTAITVPAHADDKKELLYDVIFDTDQNKTWDRAVLVLVGPGRKDFSDLTKDRYMLEEGERVDLFIYLNGGDGPVDIVKPPTIRKENVVDRTRLPFVMPLSINAKGSLRIVSSNGFGNTFNNTETLTFVYRGGAFRIAGWATDFYNSRDDYSRHCSINYLNGTTVARINSGKDIVRPHKLKSSSLSAWKDDEALAMCEDKE